MMDSREPGELEADAVADAAADGGRNRGGEDVKEGEDGRGRDREEGDLLYGERLGREEEGDEADDQALDEVLHNALERFLHVK